MASPIGQPMATVSAFDVCMILPDCQHLMHPPVGALRYFSTALGNAGPWLYGRSWWEFSTSKWFCLYAFLLTIVHRRFFMGTSMVIIHAFNPTAVRSCSLTSMRIANRLLSSNLCVLSRRRSPLLALPPPNQSTHTNTCQLRVVRRIRFPPPRFARIRRTGRHRCDIQSSRDRPVHSVQHSDHLQVFRRRGVDAGSV